MVELCTHKIVLQATVAGFEAVWAASTELESRLLMAHAEETCECWFFTDRLTLLG